MSKLPSRFIKFRDEHPQVFTAYEALGKAAAAEGPLGKKEISLVKLAIAAGARMEGAVHSHTRRALEAGASPEEIRQVIILTVTTIGFPAMMANLSWVDDVLAKNADTAKDISASSPGVNE